MKRKRISNIIKEGRTDIFLIQESKLEVVETDLIPSLWSFESVGWSYTKSECRSG